MSSAKLRGVYLTSLTLANFRNIASLDLTFDTPVTAFVGENAQGKTNILEAITLLSIGKSLRASEDVQLIRAGEEFFRVSGEIQKETGSLWLDIAAVTMPRLTKAFRVNDRKIPASDFIGHFPTVSFFPTDLNLVLLAPSLRRRYLDIVLSQVSHEYVRAANTYAKALKQRNALLNLIADGRTGRDELDFWDAELARAGVIIGRLRNEFIDTTRDVLDERFHDIAGNGGRLMLRLTGFHAHDLSIESYREHLTRMRDKDIRYRSTGYGPHRTDLVFEIDGANVAEGGSRGEVRSTILALKFAELAFIEAKTATRPVLLLDDVFSELDRGRQERLMGLLSGYQTLITTTKLEHLVAVPGEKQILTVENGSVKISS